MLNRIARYSFLLFFVGLLTACAGSPFYHENFMRGQIVDINDDSVVICVGGNDGAEPGQNLAVYRVVYEQMQVNPNTYGEFKKKYVGEIKINSIIDEHFARASITSGDVNKHDIVELKE